MSLSVPYSIPFSVSTTVPPRRPILPLRVGFGAIHHFDNQAEVARYLATPPTPLPTNEVFIGSVVNGQPLFVMVDGPHGQIIDRFESLLTEVKHHFFDADFDKSLTRRIFKDFFRRRLRNNDDKPLNRWATAQPIVDALLRMPEQFHQHQLQHLVYSTLAGVPDDALTYSAKNPRQIDRFMSVPDEE